MPREENFATTGVKWTVQKHRFLPRRMISARPGCVRFAAIDRRRPAGGKHSPRGQEQQRRSRWREAEAGERMRKFNTFKGAAGKRARRREHGRQEAGAAGREQRPAEKLLSWDHNRAAREHHGKLSTAVKESRPGREMREPR